MFTQSPDLPEGTVCDGLSNNGPLVTIKYFLTHPEFKPLKRFSVDLIKDGHKSYGKVDQNEDVVLLLSAGILQEIGKHGVYIQQISAGKLFMMQVNVLSLKNEHTLQFRMKQNTRKM